MTSCRLASQGHSMTQGSVSPSPVAVTQMYSPSANHLLGPSMSHDFSSLCGLLTLLCPQHEDPVEEEVKSSSPVWEPAPEW